MRHRRTGENNQSEGMPNLIERIEEEQMDISGFQAISVSGNHGSRRKIIIYSETQHKIIIIY
jgi:glycine cleavage system protein P-like pyridoxal-binding family